MVSNSSRQLANRHTLFINNLSTEAEEEDIQKLFDEKVPGVKIEAIRLVRDKVDSSKRGIAFVDVETHEMAEDALKLNECKIKGQEIIVHLSKPKADKDADVKTTFLNNLPFTTTETSLRELVKELLPDVTIEEIRLIRD